MSKNEEIKFQIFDGHDYSIWKNRLLLHLRWKKCDEPAIKERTPETQDDWNEKDLQAMNYVYESITNEQLEFVGEEESAFKIIKKFDQIYLKESTALQICVRSKLDKMRLKNFEDASSQSSKKL